VQATNFKGFEDSWDPLRIATKYGLYKGDAFLTWMKQCITGKGLAATATFADFQKADMLDLRVFASDLNTRSLKEFSVATTPDTIVAEAIRASISIPLLFQAWTFSNGNPDNHGEKRYLQKVLFACGALRSLPSSTNLVKDFAAESDAAKIDAKFPVLKKLCERLNALKPTETLVISTFVKDMRGAPVGASGTMLVLALALGRDNHGWYWSMAEMWRWRWPRVLPQDWPGPQC